MASGTRTSTRDDSGLAHPAPRARSSRLRIQGAVLLLGLLAIAGPDTTVAAPEVRTVAIVETRREHNERVFATAWEWVNSHYYDAAFNGLDWAAARAAHLEEALAAGDEAELYAVIARMIQGIGDMHTRVVSPSEVRETGGTQRALLGFVSRPAVDAPERWTIIGVMPGSPAAGAGVKPGWTLAACDGLPPAAVLGTGEPLEAGREVRCEFSDESAQSHTLTLAAAEVPTRTIRESRLIEAGRLYVRFDEFTPDAATWLREELRTHADATAIVLDLRFNPGGEVAVLEEIAGEFFAEPADLGSLVARDGEAEPMVSRRAGDAAPVRGRVAVLVSSESMSCAEILAAALQHHRRALIVGARTAGMVLGTVGIPLPGGGELQLSVWDYRTPAGSRLERLGVSPDITLDRSIELTTGIQAAFAALASSTHSAALQ